MPWRPTPGVVASDLHLDVIASPLDILGQEVEDVKFPRQLVRVDARVEDLDHRNVRLVGTHRVDQGGQQVRRVGKELFEDEVVFGVQQRRVIPGIACPLLFARISTEAKPEWHSVYSSTKRNSLKPFWILPDATMRDLTPSSDPFL